MIHFDALLERVIYCTLHCKFIVAETCCIYTDPAAVLIFKSTPQNYQIDLAIMRVIRVKWTSEKKHGDQVGHFLCYHLIHQMQSEWLAHHVRPSDSLFASCLSQYTRRD